MAYRIAIVNTMPIPSGEASVNRLLSYSKGLVEMGNNVAVLSSAKPSGMATGVIDGVNYCCFGRKEGSAFSLLGSLVKIKKSIKKNHYDIIILVSNSLFLIYPLAILCKTRHIKLIQEKSEFPFVLMHKDSLHKLFAKFYVNTTYKLFDGIICMTKPLMKYFSDKVKKDCKLFEMPMTVDVSRFNMEKNADAALGRYIAYCGNMSGNKDGVANLIDAFKYVEPKHPEMKLLLIGGTNNPKGLEQLKNKVSQLGLKNVVFYGRASRDEIPRLLKDACVLALARPASLQSSGGFPTKLGEYLSTGNPVVVTAVGDIPLYLNETNSFIVIPDDNKAFAEKMLWVLDNYEQAKLIGKKGKELALTVFNSKVQVTRLNEYLHSII